MNPADLPSPAQAKALRELVARGTCWTTRGPGGDGRINGNIAGRLLRAGWAARGPTDGDAYVYRITDKGRAALAEVDR